MEKAISKGKKEDARYNVLKSFYSTRNIDFKSDLKDKEIDAILTVESTEDYLKKEFKIDLSTSFITNKLKYLKVSRNRQGRAEAIEVLKEQLLNEQEKAKRGIANILGV